MKEFKTIRYFKKEAIGREDLPIGDPGLPGNLTERDIPGGLDPDEIDNKIGETEIEIDWPKFNIWFENEGDSLPDWLKQRKVATAIWLLYKYDYDYSENKADNIKIIQIKDYETGQMIDDPYILQSFANYYDDQIREDIEIGEEDAKIERHPNYNPFEE